MNQPAGSDCQNCRARIWLYLDGELDAEECAVFGDHLRNCSVCSQQLNEEREFQNSVRDARTGNKAPEAFRRRLHEVLASAEASYNGAGSKGESKGFRQARRNSRFTWAAWQTVAAGVAGMVILMWLLGQSQRKEKAIAFVEMAGRLHNQQLKGAIPLDFKSDSPSQISSWLSERVPFRFRLPMYSETSETGSAYHLQGCRLVHWGTQEAAYIVYEMQGSLISLLVTSAANAETWGGDQTVSRGLTFHSLPVNGFRAVTWSAHQLTYALVSGVDLPPRQSCVVCHAAEKDQPLLKSFPKAQSSQSRMFPAPLGAAALIDSDKQAISLILLRKFDLK